MQITFAATAPAGASLVAYIVATDALSAGLEAAVVAGASAARFKGKTGQLFETFVERGGKVVRIALAGSGDAGAADRAAGLEKAGAALTARYLTSGETQIVVDLSEAGLDAAGAASVLLGLRLRAWRHDAYRTRLKDEQKITLTSATVVSAPDGAEAAWAVEAMLAEGVEFTRNLVAEPGNIDAHDERIVRLDGDRQSDAGTGCRAGDELELAGRGELSEDADLHEVAVDAVVGDPVLKDLFVRNFDVPTVDVATDVPMPEPALHVLEEPARVPRRVAKVERHRLAVGQAALAHLVDPIRHS